MNKDKLAALYTKYDLGADDIYKHKHYLIITRLGIDKIQAKEKIAISYEVVKCEKDFSVVKASASVGDYKIQTFGSALFGETKKVEGKWKTTGTTQSWYVMEIAEKRAMSRAVLKLTGFYELGVFGEDESEDFKKKEETPPATVNKSPTITDEQVITVIDWAVRKGWTIKIVEKNYTLTEVQKAIIVKGLKANK